MRQHDLRVSAGGAQDWFIGGNGDDTIISRDIENVAISDPDTVSGNAGNDRAQLDYIGAAIPDLYTSIEELLA